MEGEASSSSATFVPATMPSAQDLRHTVYPHPDSQLADLGRICPTLTNPKGYPPYDVSKVTSYTNSQINYYLRRNMIPNISAFQKAKKVRDELFRDINREPTSDGEPDISHDNQTSNEEARPTSNPSLPQDVTPLYTLEDDEEPDDVFPEPAPNEKGLKTEKITTLKQDGGVVNFKVWCSELKTVFETDRARYNTAIKRIAFASLQFDDSMRSLWMSQTQTHPHLTHHWRKFLRWVEQNHLHGEADRHKYLMQYHHATQGENEEPTQFYARLSLLATVIERKLTHDDVISRLREGLQDVLIRNGRKGKNIEELLANAQETWATFKNKKRKREDKPFKDSFKTEQHPQKGTRFRIGGRSQGQANKRQRISDEEYAKRKNNNLCLRCGKPGHFASNCLTNPLAKDTRPGQSKEATPVQSTTPQHALRQNFGEYKRQRARVQPVEATDDHLPSDDSDSDYQTDNQESEPKN
jgi:hypothetical protein